MSLSGARGLVALSHNTNCQYLACMIATRPATDERALYRAISGREYRGEFGQRPSAIRRGVQFERALYQDSAKRLRNVLAPLLSYDPDGIRVIDLSPVIEGNEDTRGELLARTRDLMAQLEAGGVGGVGVYLLLQPQLQISVGQGEYRYIAPDALIYDVSSGVLIPVECKSWIVRGGVADGADLDRARRQAAVECLALRNEAARIGLAGGVQNRYILVHATPFGFLPGARMERIDAAVIEIERAILALGRALQTVSRTRGEGRTQLVDMWRETSRNYGEECSTICLLASLCQEENSNRARVLGETAAEFFGPDSDLERIRDILLRKIPEAACTPYERNLLYLSGQLFPQLLSEMELTIAGPATDVRPL